MDYKTNTGMSGRNRKCFEHLNIIPLRRAASISSVKTASFPAREETSSCNTRVNNTWHIEHKAHSPLRVTALF